jgi:hypothetical protein
MILGYILICGMGWTTPGAIEGCVVYPEPFANFAECESVRLDFLDSYNPPEGYYVDDSRCIVIGTGV